MQLTIEDKTKELQALQVQLFQQQELFQKQMEGWKLEKSFMKDHITELENSQTQSILSQHIPSTSHHSTNPTQRQVQYIIDCVQIMELMHLPQRQSDGNSSQDPELGDISPISNTLHTFLTEKKEEIGAHPWLVSLWRLMGYESFLFSFYNDN